MSAELLIRFADREDLTRLHPVIERAYRGDSARQGWTHEADLVEGDRTDLAELTAIVADPARRLLIVEHDGVIVGCVSLTDRGRGIAYLGHLCVEPTLQGDGIGKRLLAAVERAAVDIFEADRIEMTVIDRRADMIAYYERRGYALTGERRPFPIAVTPPLAMVVLEKPLRVLVDD